jgi:hypothetical protein
MDRYLDSLDRHQQEPQITPQELAALEEAKCLLDLYHSKAWGIFQAFLLTLPKYPNPTDYPKFEDLMIAYTKAYGTSEAVREIHEFMAKQEYEVKRLTKKQNDPQEYGL